MQALRPNCFTGGISTLIGAKYNWQNYLCRIWRGKELLSLQFWSIGPQLFRLSYLPRKWTTKDSVININWRRCKTRITWNRSQNFRFYKCYDIYFYNFCTQHILNWKKNTSEVWNNDSPNISPIFWMLRAVKYLSEFSFTFPFFSIYLKYLDTNKMMDKVEISVWNIWMWRKWEAKFRNP